MPHVNTLQVLVQTPDMMPQWRDIYVCLGAAVGIKTGENAVGVKTGGENGLFYSPQQYLIILCVNSPNS